MDLTLERGRVDDGSDIVDDGIVEDLDRARVSINLELADMATIGEGISRRFEGSGFVEPSLEVGREPGWLERGARHLLEGERAIGAGNGEPAVGKVEIRRGYFEQMG